MDIQHTGKDFELTQAIKAHAEEKFGKAATQLDGYSGIRLHLTYETEGHSNHGDTRAVHAVLFVPNHEPLKANESADDLYAAIDAAAKDIERQITRYREKAYGQQRGRNGGLKQGLPES